MLETLPGLNFFLAVEKVLSGSLALGGLLRLFTQFGMDLVRPEDLAQRQKVLGRVGRANAHLPALLHLPPRLLPPPGGQVLERSSLPEHLHTTFPLEMRRRRINSWSNVGLSKTSTVEIGISLTHVAQLTGLGGDSGNSIPPNTTTLQDTTL